MISALARRSLVNYLGIFVLLAGFSVGDYKYWRSLQTDQEPSDEAMLLSQYNFHAYAQSVQRNVGTFGMLVNQWSLTLARLGEPRPFAITIMAVSGLVAGGCFFVASRMPRA